MTIYLHRKNEVDAIQWTGKNMEEIRAYFPPTVKLHLRDGKKRAVFMPDERGVLKKTESASIQKLLVVASLGKDFFLEEGHWVVANPIFETWNVYSHHHFQKLFMRKLAC